ncbi:DNA excision repair protein ERCC-1-like isoform X2 [Salvia miltiorrhiza]|uniref:DNA excision repair protein ERCC-1-like isoform X2 n=1 Tax=Salvia miltiorrhiza TaxID=226208 RepID=UPI0025AD638C|nr:DNA excision repair protein ERCC-1-like isoform X2 [Salvia miltiorrhiza]
MENRGDPEQQRQNNASFVVKIPSYEEVVESSQPNSQSLFKPSSSFSQAFNFIKNTEFYTTPPSVPVAQSSKDAPSSSQGSYPRQTIQSEAPSTSVSSAGANRNAIIVSHRQKGNPLLKHIRNVRWVFADVVCDYLLGQNACALYLSLRYHLLHPDYLYFRIRELQKNFKLRVVLCHVDVEDVVKPLLEVTKTALLHDCTLLCAWSLEECGRYLETIKVYENKPADLIQGQMDMDYISRLNHALTSIRHVNKTDVVTLGSTFGSLSNIMDASMEDLARCPGIGERKVRRLYDTFHEPFKRAVPNPAAPVAENPIASVSERNEEVEENQETSREHKKEEEISVRSALKAALPSTPAPGEARGRPRCRRKRRRMQPTPDEPMTVKKVRDESFHSVMRWSYYRSFFQVIINHT